MQEHVNKIQAAATVVRKHWPKTPRAGIILGSGLSSLAEKIQVESSLDYQQLPHFPSATATGHRSQLICGHLADVPVIAFQGRFHLYEGYTAKQSCLPVWLMHALGADTLVVTNAAGGINPAFDISDLMLIEDQINLMFANPLVGLNDDSLGPRFPDMSAPYDRKLIEVATSVAMQHQLKLHQGVYVSMTGPTYETRAEYRLARRLGGDAVGMSTVPEVIAARHAGLRVLGLTSITNVGSPDKPCQNSGEEVIHAAAKTANRISKIILGVLQTFSS